MPEWMHQRAEHILAKNPSMPKGEAFAIATQQMHALGKGPKSYGTAEGKRVAKAKFATPKDDKKTANPGGLKSPKLAAFSDELQKLAKEDPRAPVLPYSVARKELKPGDILLSHVKNREGAVSKVLGGVIEKAQGTPYAHASIYAGNGEVVEAQIQKGVISTPLSKFEKKNDYQIFRPQIPPKQKADAVAFAREAVGNKDYTILPSIKGLVPFTRSKVEDVQSRLEDRKDQAMSCGGLIAAALPQVNWGRRPREVLPVDFAKSTHTKQVATVTHDAPKVAFAAFSDELQKLSNAFEFPVIQPGWQQPRLDKAIQKNSGSVTPKDGPPQGDLATKVALRKNILENGGETSLPIKPTIPNPQPETSDKYATRVKGKPLKEKDSDFAVWSPGDFRPANLNAKHAMLAMPTEKLAEFVEELRKESMTPAGQLSKSTRIGAPRASAPPGPSIADIAKPKGAHFGTGTAGSFKSGIGGTAPAGLK